MVLGTLCTALHSGSAAFLEIMPNARASALGGSGCAVSGEHSAFFSNPAALSPFQKREFSFTHTEWLMEVQYDALTAVFPTGSGLFGFAAGYLHMPPITKTLINAASPSGFTEAGEYTSDDKLFILSYARRLYLDLHGGLSVKYVQERIDDITASGVMADLGVFYKKARMDFGLSLLNAGSGMRYISISEAAPLTVKAGLSFRPGNAFFVLESAFPLKGKPEILAGAEYSLTRILAFRAGLRYKTGAEYDFTSFLTAGIGLRLPFFEREGYYYELDYSFRPNSDLDNVHRVTLSGRF